MPFGDHFQDHDPNTCPDRCGVRPEHSYSGLIIMAILSSVKGKLSFNMICDFIRKSFPYYGHMPTGKTSWARSGWQNWQRAIRDKLLVERANKIFRREPRDHHDLGKDQSDLNKVDYW